MVNFEQLVYRLVLSDKKGNDLLTGYPCSDLPSLYEQMDALVTYFRIAIYCDPDDVVKPTILKMYPYGEYHPYRKVYNHKGDFLYIGFICVEVDDIWNSQE